jgi:predicted SAM-dependent methyltransferase
MNLLKLHLGCGMRYIPGFVHVDINDAPHIDHCLPLDDLSFFKSDSVDLIYASHVLEHFGRNEVQAVLNGWYRILKPGGILRLAVPDFSSVVKLYENEGLKDGLSGLIGLVCGGQRNQYDFHKIILTINNYFLVKLMIFQSFLLDIIK